MVINPVTISKGLSMVSAPYVVLSGAAHINVIVVMFFTLVKFTQSRTHGMK